MRAGGQSPQGLVLLHLDTWLAHPMAMTYLVFGTGSPTSHATLVGCTCSFIWCCINLHLPWGSMIVCSLRHLLPISKYEYKVRLRAYQSLLLFFYLTKEPTTHARPDAYCTHAVGARALWAIRWCRFDKKTWKKTIITSLRRFHLQSPEGEISQTNKPVGTVQQYRSETS